MLLVLVFAAGERIGGGDKGCQTVDLEP